MARRRRAGLVSLLFQPTWDAQLFDTLEHHLLVILSFLILWSITYL
jgi:hypothetical protein